LSKQIIVGRARLDAAILDLLDGRVMAIAEDPIFPAPGLPLEIMGWFTAAFGASDVVLRGYDSVHDLYVAVAADFPESDAETIIVAISDAARELGISVVGGHTGWYDAVVVHGCGVTVWGIADKSAWVSPGGAQDGDIILMTKGPAIEAVALLAILTGAASKISCPASRSNKRSAAFGRSPW